MAHSTSSGQAPQEESFPGQRLLANSLNMDHSKARSLVFDSLEEKRVGLSTNEELAFVHVYNCMEPDCQELWQGMRERHSDEKSQAKLYVHEEFSDLRFENVGLKVSTSRPPESQTHEN